MTPKAIRQLQQPDVSKDWVRASRSDAAYNELKRKCPRREELCRSRAHWTPYRGHRLLRQLRAAENAETEPNREEF
jgi:hypothetical protein